jgi:PAS domain S-box-containing protein
MHEDLGALVTRLSALRGAATLLQHRHHQEIEPQESPDATVNPVSQMRVARSQFVDFTLAFEKHHPTIDNIRTLSEKAIADYERLIVLATVSKNQKEIQEVHLRLEGRLDKLIKIIDLTIQAELSRMGDLSRDSSSTIRSLTKLHYAVIILSLASSYALGILLASRLSKPIQEMLETANRIGSGDLTARVENSSADELGQLADALNSMVSKLQQTTVSREYLDHIIQSLPDALFVLDPGGKISTTNAGAEHLLGYSANELQGTSFSSLVANNRNSSLPQQFTDQVTQTPAFTEMELRTYNGSNVPVQISASTLLDSNSAVAGQICVAKDIGERLRLEFERDRYKSALARSEQLASLGTVAAIIAHKINQPLTAIQLFIQQCLRENDENIQSDLIEDHLHDCLEEVSRATQTVKEVLRMSRQPELTERSSYSLRAVVDKVAMVLREQMREANMQFEIQGTWDGLATYGRAGELDSVFFFLIQNATQAASARGRGSLIVSAEPHDSLVDIHFQDQCGGIQEKDLDKIFELFFTTKPPGEGSGLGLPIVQQIVHRLEGKISVSSRPGEGSTFTVTLPLVALVEEQQSKEDNDNEQKTIFC